MTERTARSGGVGGEEMARAIAGGRVDLGPLVRPESRADLSGIVALVESDAGLQEQFVRDAHTRLGAPGAPPLNPWRELHRSRSLKRAGASSEPTLTALLNRNRHAIGVPLGTSVVLPEGPFDPHPWTIVGAGRSNRLDLVRRLPDGKVQRQTRRWPELVLANPGLAEHHLISWQGPGGKPMLLREQVPQGAAWSAAVGDAYDAARAALAPAARRYELVSSRLRLQSEGNVLDSGSWEQLARKHKLTRLRPIPVFPSDPVASANIVHASGSTPTRFVFAAEADAVLGGSLLVGTDRLAPGHRATADAIELERIASFYERLGLKTWRDPGDGLLLTTGRLKSVGNASVRRDDELALIDTGPRDISTTDTLTSAKPYEVRKAMRHADRAFRSNSRIVLAHEVGHVALNQHWMRDIDIQRDAARKAGDMAAFARLSEHRLAEEAFSDLFGASYGGSRDNGVRDLGRLRKGTGDLVQLRATIEALSFEYSGHTGTQLVTKPMLELQRRRGWDAVAETTAGATKQLGAMLGRGEIDAIDVPAAARALRDAAAMRWGAEDEAVRAMVRAWQKLRVLV